MRPRAFIGSAEDGAIYAMDEGSADGASAYNARGQTNPIAPSGADMDSSFDRVYVTLTWSMDATVRCTPIVDGTLVTAAQFDITLTGSPLGERQSRVFERALFKPFMQDGVEQYREGLRGTWFALRLETVGGVADGELIFDEVTLEYTPGSPTKEIVS